jgi:hypothetical protein
MSTTYPSAVFDDLDAIKLLYRNGDLPENQRIFPYYATPADRKTGKVTWVHQDHLKNLAALDSAYPQANTQKGKK